jgi:hypothetical protein
MVTLIRARAITMATTTTAEDAGIQTPPTENPIMEANGDGKGAPDSIPGTPAGSKKANDWCQVPSMENMSSSNDFTEDRMEPNLGPKVDQPDDHPEVPDNTTPDRINAGEIQITAEVVLKSEPESGSKGCSDCEILEETSLIEVNGKSTHLDREPEGDRRAR